MAVNQPTDLSNCDREIISRPGAIQAYGGLIVCNLQGNIVSISKNLSEFLPESSNEWIGKNIAALGVIPTDFHFTSSFLRNERVYQGTKSETLQFLEVFRLPGTSPMDLGLRLRSEYANLQSAEDWASLLNQSAKIVKALTGFDRVMIYQFHEDLHGQVVAEAVSEGIDSYLGLHYPASDIPLPARKVFLDNWVRTIPNVDAIPVDLICEKITADEMDLGKISLRAVSPVHLEYLRNMGVKATLTVSLKSAGKLWGLIACHHYSEKTADFYERGVMEDLGMVVSSLIHNMPTTVEFKSRVQLREVHGNIVARMQNTNDLAEELTQYYPNIIDLIRSEGASAALYLEHRWVSTGKVPDESQLSCLVSWLSENHGDKPVFSTDRLPELFPESEAFKNTACGVIAISMPKSPKHYILVFRPEIMQTVRWAGNPNAKKQDANGRLHPRSSFAEWSESVKNRSERWLPWELEAAEELRASIMAVDLRKQYIAEQKARNEAEKAMQAREELMQVMSHDLKNPINAIMLSSKLLERSLKKGDAKNSNSIVSRIFRASQGMNNLINDLLHMTKIESGRLDIDAAPTDMIEVISETIDLLNPIASDRFIDLALVAHPGPCMVFCEKERIVQVLSNLIGNAIKFSEANDKVEIGIESCGPEFCRVYVKDQGPGVPEENRLHVFDRYWQARDTSRLGTGLGLAIAKGMVVSHRGEIWVEENPEGGAIFKFTLPMA